MKTASFGQNRRIGAAWIGSRKENRDRGEVQRGGNLVFRELVQMPDGTLGTTFPQEMIPKTGNALHPEFSTLTAGGAGSAARVTLNGVETHEVAQLASLPHSYRLRCTVRPAKDTYSFGLGLRGSGAFELMQQLSFSSPRRTVQLEQEQIDCVDGLDNEFTLDVLLHDDIIDVCIDGRRCIIDRLPERRGEKLFFYCHNGVVSFDDIELHELPVAVES